MTELQPHTHKHTQYIQKRSHSNPIFYAVYINLINVNILISEEKKTPIYPEDNAKK